MHTTKRQIHLLAVNIEHVQKDNYKKNGTANGTSKILSRTGISNDHVQCLSNVLRNRGILLETNMKRVGPTAKPIK